MWAHIGYLYSGLVRKLKKELKISEKRLDNHACVNYNIDKEMREGGNDNDQNKGTGIDKKI